MNVKKFKKVVLMSLAMSTFIVGCAGESGNSSTTTTMEEVSTKEKETTTTAEITTQEITTEEPTTKYVKKGVTIIVDKKNAEHFNGLVIESGYTFYINEFIVNPEEIQTRGDTALLLLCILGIDTTQFEAKYFPFGYQAPEVPYEDNYSFTYTGDKKYTFTYMYEKDNGYVYFDFHEVK